MSLCSILSINEMTLSQLRVFVAVAERMHLTRAAQALGMTQSATSAALSTLERQTGVRLFDRVGRGLELSEAGQRFLPEAIAVLDRVKHARAALEQASKVVSGTVSVGASQTVANYWLPRRLAVLHKSFPDIQLDIRVGNTRTVEKSVVEREVDIGLVEGPTTNQVLIRRVVDVDRPVLVVSARESVQLGQRGRLDPERLIWVIREEGSGTRHLLADLCEAEGISFESLRILMVLPSNEAVREAVECGIGATIISEQVVAASIQSGRLRSVAVDLPEREFALIRHSERALTPSQRALVDILTLRPVLSARRGHFEPPSSSVPDAGNESTTTG